MAEREENETASNRTGQGYETVYKRMRVTEVIKYGSRTTGELGRNAWRRRRKNTTRATRKNSSSRGDANGEDEE